MLEQPSEPKNLTEDDEDADDDDDDDEYDDEYDDDESEI